MEKRFIESSTLVEIIPFTFTIFGIIEENLFHTNKLAKVMRITLKRMFDSIYKNTVALFRYKFLACMIHGKR